MTRAFWTDLLRRIDNSTPRQAALICFIMGAANALAMPPVYAFPILAITFPLWIRFLDQSQTTRQAFIRAFLFHWGFHIAGLYWITHALFVDLANNWWVIPFALVSLPALMAIYPALAVTWWYRTAWQGTARFLALIALLAASEWVRGVAFTGFPWNLWGYAWVSVLPVMQITALIGIYGLTALTLLAACAPALLYPRYRERALRLCMGGFALCVLIAVVWGAGRLSVPMPSAQNSYQLRIVQPNIKQEAKWDPAKAESIERLLWTYSVQPFDTGAPDLIVWPETSLGIFRTDDVKRLQYYAQHFLPEKTILALGTLENDINADGETVFVNRADFINHTGERISYYDKFHLVPFGEYLPFQNLWPVRPVAFRNGSLQAGSGIKTIDTTNGLSLSPMICYEIIFPSHTLSDTERPKAILNLTNDAWYGNTSGPYQHFAITRTRAIEEGVPVIRAANTGISGVVDPFGRIVKKLPLNTRGVIDTTLPPSIDPTFFARWGNTPFFLLTALLWLLAWSLQYTRTRTSSVSYVR